MIAEGYDLHVYCTKGGRLEEFHEFGEFAASSRRKAWAAARRAGWKLGRGEAWCPECAKARPAKKGDAT